MGDSAPRERWGMLLKRLLRNGLIAAAILTGITLSICWFVGWRSLYLVGQGLLFAGVASIALGILSIVGAWNNRGSFNYQFSRSASHLDIGSRASQDMRYVFGSNAFLITMLIAGLIMILMGYIVQSFANVPMA